MLEGRIHEPAENKHGEMLREARQEINTDQPTEQYLTDIRTKTLEYAESTEDLAHKIQVINDQLDVQPDADGGELYEMAKDWHPELQADTSTFEDSDSTLVTQFPVESNGPIQANLAMPLNGNEPTYIIGPYQDPNYTQVEQYKNSRHADDYVWTFRPAFDIGSLAGYVGNSCKIGKDSRFQRNSCDSSVEA